MPQPVSDDLPNGIPEILSYLAQMARGYNNHLKWNEVAKLKGDLMNVPSRWRGVSASAIADRRSAGKPSGKARTATRTPGGSPSRPTAQKYATRMEGDALRGVRYADPRRGAITVREYGEAKFMLAMLHLRPNSADTYRSHLKNHICPALGDRRMGTITKTDVQSFVTALSRKPVGECGEKTCSGPAHCLPKGTRFHDLRHFYASTLIAANLNPKVIQARLGHPPIAETMDTYGHLFPDSEELGRGAIDAVLGSVKSRSESVSGRRESWFSPARTH